jgi:hypothetical protein
MDEDAFGRVVAAALRDVGDADDGRRRRGRRGRVGAARAYP